VTSPWPLEDGGPRRTGRPVSLPGPRAGSAEVAAHRDTVLSVMALLDAGDDVLVLRNSVGPDGVSWVERVDPLTLAVRHQSPDLALGPYWPGGMGLLDDASVVVVQGRHAHRLDAALHPVATHRFAVDAPHNSFVVLADGSLAAKDLQRPDGSPSVLSVLDPVTLTERCAPLVLPEPSVARLSADGNDIVVVGVDCVFVVRFDPVAGGLSLVGDPMGYRTGVDQSFGWDPVIDAGAVWWLDNGDHNFPNGFTMVGNAVSAGPVRLWKWTPGPDWTAGTLASVEVCGLPGGAVTNPPLVDEVRGVVLGYDSANGVLAAFGIADLSPQWRTDLNTATHLVAYGDTGEVVANDFVVGSGDSLVVLDVATGAVTARAGVDSPAQSVVFGCPGRHRDFIYVSLSTVARVTFGD